MAASQARLLSITARIHDVEYQAQSIQNAKIQLATQEDQVYQEFLDAQDATTLTINMLNNGQTSTITANFNNLCSKNRVVSADGSQYTIFDERGRIVVEDDVDKCIDSFDNAYAFAAYMVAGILPGEILNSMGEIDNTDGSNAFEENILKAEEDVYNSISNDPQRQGSCKNIIKLHEKLQGLTGSTDIYDDHNITEPENREEYEETLNAYRKALYNVAADEILESACGSVDSSIVVDVEGFNDNMPLFKYYVNLFNQIKSNPAGCISIEEFNGPDGDAANNSDWLQDMIKSGQFSIRATLRNGETKDICPGSDISLGYTQTTQIDNAAYAKAEAKYEHDLRQLDKKDKAFDTDLSKLETERAALTKEYDSVKTVIKDNIERTFGIFS